MELRDYQKECINTIESQPPGAYLVQMATGLGKCFAKGTKVLMFDGTFKFVEDIHTGDTVMGWDSQPRRVESIAHGTEEMYRIERSKHEPYIVNASHILSLKITGLSNKRAKRVTDSLGRVFTAGDICNIEVKDYLKCSKTFKHTAKGFCVPVDFESHSVPVDPYYIGLWLGDGNNRALKITTEDYEIVEYLSDFSKRYGFELEELKSHSGNAKDYYLKDYKHNPVRAYLRQNLFLNKHIPLEYIANSREVRLQVLAGLLDTDGTLHTQDKATFEFCSKYYELRNQVAFLCQTLGLTARCFKRHNKKYNSDFYYCTIFGNTSEIPTRIERKKAINNPNKNNLMHGISVHPLGIGEYFGFELSGNDRMFLLWDCTVVHNTVTFANLPRHGERMLILSHREELVEQPRKYFDCTYGVERAENHAVGEEVVSASVQSLVRRLDRFDPQDFGLIICDECFPGTVCVDGKPLTEYKCGDIIASYNHMTEKIEQKKVTHVFKRKPNSLVRVYLENGQSIICTRNHPFWVENKSCYIEACMLTEDDYVLYLHDVPKGNQPKQLHEKTMEEQNGRTEKKRKNLLLDRMFKKISLSKFFEGYGGNKQKVRKRKNEEEQSDEKAGSAGESIESFKRNRTLPENPLRKRSRNDCPAAKSSSCDQRIRTLCRIPNTDKSWQKKRMRISDLLQSRYCHSVSFGSDRSRRKQPFFDCAPKARREENKVFGIVRVGRVEVYEQTGDGTFGGLCPDGYVYNLEVEDNHNYFANGFLVHNCHHAAANTYRKIFEYFQPEKLIGFTATPNRGDKVRLSDVFQKIIFQRDLRWGIQNKYLCDILCKRVDIGYDLRAVHTRNGDYAPGELDEAMEGTADAIAQTYREHAVGATLIFAVSVHQAEEIAGRIKGAVVVTGETKNRAAIIEAFTAGEIPCIVNCMVFTEGTDIPRVETVIVARPTQSESLYAQMVGRGLRLYPGKERLVLIDCVGVTGKASLCTAPSLLGLDLSNIPARKVNEIQGDLFDLPLKIAAAGDCPESWIKNVEIVDLWAQEQKYNTHDMNIFRRPDGSLTCSIPGKKFFIPAQDFLGKTVYKGRKIGMQQALDELYQELCDEFSESSYIWDLNKTKRWGRAPASEKQIKIISRRCKGFDTNGLTKLQASQILNRIMG